MPSGRRAFVLVELLLLIGVVVVACVICALLLPDARRRAQLAGSIQNLLQLGAASQAYAADNDNRVASFSWQPYPTLHNCNGYSFAPATSYNDAASQQAVCIIRERGNRPDITAMQAWIPFVGYNYLPLIDYLDGELPSPMVVSPGDASRIAWQRAARVAAADPNDFGQAFFRLQCRPPGNSNNERRWPYSSSYEVQPSFYSPDARINDLDTIGQDDSAHFRYTTGSTATILGNRRFDEVRYPSNKAYMYEANSYYFGKPMFFAYAEARIPVLHGDGSAFVRSMQRANPGFRPNNPQSTSPSRFQYTPTTTWEPPTPSGVAGELVTGSIRWTRSGLRGRDFQGPDVHWTP